MGRPKAAKVSRTDLIKRVAKDCNYYEYEVDDVLSALSRVLLETLSNGESVLLEGIGTFEVQQPKTLKYYDQRFDGKKVTLTTPKLTFRPSATIKQRLITDEFLAAKASLMSLPATKD